MSKVMYTKMDKLDLAEFEQLCKHVDKIDSGAAKFLRRLARGWNPISLKTNGIDGVFTPDELLLRCFLLHESGEQISVVRWYAIAERLGEL